MRIREALARPLNGYSAKVVLIVTLSLVIAGLSIGFRMNRNSEKKFCEIAQSNAAAYRDTPPTTETGKRIAENWDALIQRLRCPTEKG